MYVLLFTLFSMDIKTFSEESIILFIYAHITYFRYFYQNFSNEKYKRISKKYLLIIVNMFFQSLLKREKTKKIEKQQNFYQRKII